MRRRTGRRVGSWAVIAALALLAGAGASPAADSMFLPQHAVTNSGGGLSVAVGDVTADGRNDAVRTTDSSEPRVEVFAQIDGGKLADPVSYPTQGNQSHMLESVVIGDVTRDGLNDVIVGIDGLGLQIFPGLGSGGLGQATFRATPNSTRVEAGNLNGDGCLDIVGVGENTNTADLFLNDCNGGLAPAVPHALVARGVSPVLTLGDVNGDGRTDVVVAGGRQGVGLPDVSVLLQLPGGGLAAAAGLYTGLDAHGLGIAELTGDDRADLALATTTQSALYVFPQTAGGSFGQAIPYPSYNAPSAIRTGDLDGDGRTDLVVFHAGWGRAGVYRKLPAGGLAPEELHEISTASNMLPQGGALGDVNGDGRLDVMTVRSGLRVMLHAGPPLPFTKLTAADDVGPGGLGVEVALSADGNTALVGAPFDSDGTGAAWVFTRSGSAWTQQAKLTGAGMSGTGLVGLSVALSAGGNTALVGGPGDNGGIGAAWAFTRTGGSWTQQGPKLTASGSSGQAGVGFGVALSSDGNTAVIGGPFDNGDVGAAWAFTRSGATWTQQGGKLTGAGMSGRATFGFAVAVSSDGNTALIGGPDDGSLRGAAWVFTRSGATWAQQGSKLFSVPDSRAVGFSVALSGNGNTALLGGPDDFGGGSAWVFTRAGATWAQQGGRLLGEDAESGAHSFGYDVALSEDGARALIGGPGDVTFRLSGAWFFVRSGTTWAQQGWKLDQVAPPDGTAFGSSVALASDGTALIGGPDADDGRGAAWAYEPPAPGAPSGISAAPAVGGATVSFTPPPGPVSSYTVTAWPGGASATGVTSPIVVTGLAAAATYRFEVRATNGAGTGPPAQSGPMTTPGPPGAPTAVSAVGGDTHAVVSFTPPPADPAAPVLYYSVTASGGGGAAYGLASPITVHGLANGVSYTFTVTAVNGVGPGTPSAASAPVTPAGGERPHPEPPAESPRPEIPAFTAPSGPRPPPPGH